MVKIYFALLLVSCIWQELNFQIVTNEQCSVIETEAIVQEYTVLIEEKINSASLIVQQQITDVKNKKPDPNESEKLQEALKQIKSELTTLKQNICTRTSQLLFDYKSLKIDTLLAQCMTAPNTEEIVYPDKSQATLVKIQEARTKIALALQKCVFKSSLEGCAALRTCCEQVVSKTSHKIDSKVNKISKTSAGPYNCFRKVIREALELESDLKGELLECRLHNIIADGHSTESIWSAQSNKPSLEEIKNTIHSSESVQESLGVYSSQEDNRANNTPQVENWDEYNNTDTYLP